LVFLFFFGRRLSLGQRTRTRVCGFESEEKERSEMYKIDERVFFLFVERELLHTTPGQRKKILKP